MKNREMNAAEFLDYWEDLCDGCGKCCAIHNVGHNGRDEGCGIACPSLDVETNRCNNYESRHTTEMCLPVTPRNVLELHKRGILPNSCAYVRFMQKKPRLPAVVVGRARLLPFKLSALDVQEKYLLRREEWLSNAADALDQPDDQPKSGAP
jgi:hypothetical protein